MLEYTNNMVSNFNKTILEGLPSRGNHSKITQLLAPDSALEGDGIATGGSYDNTYVAWWNIESAFPGYWSRYNNLFRYGVPQGYPTADGMSAVEKQVYYSSIATDTDLGYYFNRYGYRFNGNKFTLEGASSAYKSAVEKLILEKKLSTAQPKLWYVGADTATLVYEYGDKLAIYSEKTKISPLHIGKEGNGIIYINYYYYPGYNDWGLGQKLLTFTNSVFSDNKSGGADIFTAYNWQQLNAEGSEITASVNKKIELKSGYEGLNITLMHDTGIDGEIVRRSDTPMDSDVFDHFKLSDALAIKYRLELGQTGNSLWLRQLGFTVTIEDNGKTTTDGNNYVYGDSFTLPAAPAAPEGFEFSGWQYGDKLYNANEEITLDSGDKISAVYTQYSFRMKLVYSDGEGESTQTYRKGYIISISDLATPAGGNFAGWLYKGAVYLPGDKIVFDGRNYTFVAAYTSAETPGGDDGNSGNEGSTDNDGNTDNEGGSGNEGGTDNEGDNTPSTPADNGSLIAKIVIAVAVVLVAAAIIMVIIFVHKSRKNKRR